MPIRARFQVVVSPYYPRTLICKRVMKMRRRCGVLDEGKQCVLHGLPRLLPRPLRLMLDTTDRDKGTHRHIQVGLEFYAPKPTTYLDTATVRGPSNFDDHSENIPHSTKSNAPFSSRCISADNFRLPARCLVANSTNLPNNFMRVKAPFCSGIIFTAAPPRFFMTLWSQSANNRPSVSV